MVFFQETLEPDWFCIKITLNNGGIRKSVGVLNPMLLSAMVVLFSSG
jgi:hypothetical protein